jgi:rhodanese-related sulfurtransferase
MDITVEELKQRLDAGEEFNFLDVREEYEYEEDNLGALLIPVGELPDRLMKSKAGKTRSSGSLSLRCALRTCKSIFRNTRIY